MCPSAPLRATSPTDVLYANLRRRPGPKTRPLAERIDQLTDRTGGPDACWKWLGSHNISSGYAQISFTREDGRKTTLPVHRCLMQLHLGQKLRRDQFVLHAKNCARNCINPSHLRIGSHIENVADARAEKRYGGRLSPDQVMQLVKLHKQGENVHALRKRFRISTFTAYRILKGQSHSALTGIVYKPGKPGRKSLTDLLEAAVAQVPPPNHHPRGTA